MRLSATPPTRASPRRSSPRRASPRPSSLASDDFVMSMPPLSGATPPRTSVHRVDGLALRDFRGLMLDVCHSSVHLFPVDAARLATLRALLRNEGIRMRRDVDPLLAPSTILLASAEDLRRLVCLLPPMQLVPVQ